MLRTNAAWRRASSYLGLELQLSLFKPTARNQLVGGFLAFGPQTFSNGNLKGESK